MRKRNWFILGIVIVAVLLAVFTPLASDAPDGLEKVAETLGVHEPQPIYSAPLPDYTVPILGEGYLSTIVAGYIGLAIVVIATMLLGRALAKRGGFGEPK